MEKGLAPRILAPLVATAMVACGASPAMRAVEHGDRPALHDLLVERQRTGDLGRDAAALAKLVAERELATSPPGDAVERVLDLRSCAHELDGALALRMHTHDIAGAEAALARVEVRGLDPRRAREFVTDPDPHWRAVGARGLVRLEDREARLHALLDANPIVRREAARAARDAADPADLIALAEAVRVDPEPIVQTEAVRAIGALPALPTGAIEGRYAVAVRHAEAEMLRDLWTTGDEAVREDIALVWSSPSLWREGGRDELRTIVATGHGPPAIEAAAAVLRRRDADPELSALASGQLASAIRSGVRASRLQALAEAPLDRPELIAAVRAAADDGDYAVRIPALARLAGASDRKALVELEALASPGSPVSSRARIASAMAGDRRVQAWVEVELTSDRAEDRIAAAVALSALGVASRAAPLLADPIPRVRTRVSCVILMAARRQG
ncbi:MAG TPA: hypothetical protein VEK07_02790 [Polyangiaceae bacterium]|nr:hypothetical protein [Polyangiaceae bacterium]